MCLYFDIWPTILKEMVRTHFALHAIRVYAEWAAHFQWLCEFFNKKHCIGNTNCKTFSQAMWSAWSFYLSLFHFLGKFSTSQHKHTFYIVKAFLFFLSLSSFLRILFFFIYTSNFATIRVRALLVAMTPLRLHPSLAICRVLMYVTFAVHIR